MGGVSNDKLPVHAIVGYQGVGKVLQERNMADEEGKGGTLGEGK